MGCSPGRSPLSPSPSGVVSGRGPRSTDHPAAEALGIYRIAVRRTCAPITARLERKDRTAATDSADPIDSMEQNEPIDPIDRAEPMLPIDSTEFLEQIESTDPSER